MQRCPASNDVGCAELTSDPDSGTETEERAVQPTVQKEAFRPQAWRRNKKSTGRPQLNFSSHREMTLGRREGGLTEPLRNSLLRPRLGCSSGVTGTMEKPLRDVLHQWLAVPGTGKYWILHQPGEAQDPAS
ncbi:UNVERIFIED_CONTAM: hypothetical protein FKN15_054209 [Acipenser sinensis]